MTMDNFESMDDKQELITCNICSRSFNQKALERHIIICKKNASKPRKIFDASKQRTIEGEGIPTKVHTRKKSVPRPSPAKASPKPGNGVPAWKQKHEEFITNIRHARNITALQAAGKPLPPSLPAAENPDYVKCPYCERRFNETAAQRHMPFCKEKQHRIPVHKVHTDTAQLRNRVRVQYKAPKMRRPGEEGFSSTSSSFSPPVATPTRHSRISTNYEATPRTNSASTHSNFTPKQCSGEYQRKASTQKKVRTNNYCHDCGNRYEIQTAKFCCECGVKRIVISG